MCLHSCGTIMHVTDDGVVNKIEGDPTNPSNNGKLCPKGNSAIMRHYDPKRFKQPLKRTNPERVRTLTPCGSRSARDEALDLVADVLKKTIADDPRKILPSLEHFQKMNVWNWPLAFGNQNSFQSGGTMCGGAYHPVNGYVHSAFAVANDAKHCNYWINDGTGDGFSSHLHAAAQADWVANARIKRNMRCVTIEPRLSTSAAKSEEWIPIRPATDRHFALGLCHVMVKERRCDYEFLRKDTNAPYLVGPDGTFMRNAEGTIYVWDTKSNSARLWNDPDMGQMALEGTYEVEGKKCKPAFQKFVDILEDCTPEKMSEFTTVPAETIVRIAREFSDAATIGATIEIDGRTLPLRPAGYNYYRGAQGHKHGFQTNHAFKMVNFLVGNIDAPGGLCGVTLDDQWIDKSHIVPGENGMIEPQPHQLGPLPPFQYPPSTHHLLNYFPVGLHPPHLNLVTFENPEKYGIDFKPDVMVIGHSNPIWAMQGPRPKWFEFMRSMRFIVVCDVGHAARAPAAVGLSMPILAIDAGNTRIKWGLWEDRGFIAQGAILTAHAAQLADALHMLARPQRSIACSVASAQVRAQIEQALAPWGGGPQWVVSRREQCGVVSRYAVPEQLGADRWAALIGAHVRHAGACVVVNAGTAVTIDALDGRRRVPRRPDPAGAGADGRSAGYRYRRPAASAGPVRDLPDRHGERHLQRCPAGRVRGDRARRAQPARRRGWRAADRAERRLGRPGGRAARSPGNIGA